MFCSVGELMLADASVILQDVCLSALSCYRNMAVQHSKS